MSILYATIAKAVALRANQLKDAVNAATFNTQYAGALSSNLGGMEVPLAALKQTILASEKRIADLIGRTKNPLLRGALYGKTANVASGAQIPVVSDGNIPFVGTFSAVLDSATGNRPLTEVTKQEVFRRTANAGGFYRLPSFHFCFESTRIFHTRPSVFLEGCVWSETAQSTAFDNSNGTSPLPLQIESFWIADVLANLPQENWFINEAAVYGNLVARGEQMLMQGVVPQVVLPDSTAGENPIKN